MSEKMVLISVVPGDMYLDYSQRIWRMKEGTALEGAICEVCNCSMHDRDEPGCYSYLVMEQDDEVFVHKDCANPVVPAPLLDVWKTRVGEDTPEGEELKQRSIILVEHVIGKPGKTSSVFIDKASRRWYRRQLNSSDLAAIKLCDVCVKEFSEGNWVWSNTMEDGNVFFACTKCVWVMKFPDMIVAAEQGLNISERCATFIVCSQHSEVIRDYHQCGCEGGIGREYRCMVCDRRWYAYYSLEIESDMVTDEVYTDNS